MTPNPTLSCIRRRNEITSDILQALCDGSFSVLDLAGCSHLPDAVIRQAAAEAPNLQALDLSRCPQVKVSTLRAIARSCPDLSTIRLGGDAASSGTAAAALEHILPRVEAGREAADSWEEVAEEGGCNWVCRSLWHMPPQKSRDGS